MNSVLVAFITVAILAVWLFGWYGAGVLLLFCLYACCVSSHSKKRKIRFEIKMSDTDKK